MIVFIKDFFYLISVWLFIWLDKDLKALERQLNFIIDGVDEKRKNKFPGYYIIKAYKKRISQLKPHNHD